MENPENNKEIKTKRIRVIVENSLLGCVDRANELRVTNKEFMSLTQIQGGFVFMYYK